MSILDDMYFTRVNGTRKYAIENYNRRRFLLENSYFGGLSNVNDYSPTSLANTHVVTNSLMDFEKEETIEDVRASKFIKYSKGDALDDLGDEKGVYRVLGSFATDYVTFTLLDDPATELLQIETGTEVHTNDNVLFEVTEDVNINIGEIEVNAPVQCTDPGTIGNVRAGTITNIKTPLSFDAVVNNGSDFTNGVDREEDDDYRDRLSKHPNYYPVATKAWYEATANEIASYSYWDKSNYTLTYKPRDSGTAGLLQAKFEEDAYETPYPLYFNEASPLTVIDEATHKIMVIMNPSFDFETAKPQIVDNVTDYVNNFGLGGLFQEGCVAFNAEIVAGVVKVTLIGYNDVTIDNTHYPVINGELIVLEA